jgi:hypothetical protein
MKTIESHKQIETEKVVVEDSKNMILKDLEEIKNLIAF